jgi:hypothetical protein
LQQQKILPSEAPLLGDEGISAVGKAVGCLHPLPQDRDNRFRRSGQRKEMPFERLPQNT